VHTVDHMAIVDIDCMSTDTAVRKVRQTLRQTVAWYQITYARTSLLSTLPMRPLARISLSQSERCHTSLEADNAV
jgi:hypothetical protein